ncbi:MAG: hypothetical protein ACFFCS_20305 [Candidatus Hodarchaeota archaeon]
MEIGKIIKLLDEIGIHGSFDFVKYPHDIDPDEIEYELRELGYLEKYLTIQSLSPRMVQINYGDFGKIYSYEAFLRNLYEIEPFSAISMDGDVPFKILKDLLPDDAETYASATLSLDRPLTSLEAENSFKDDEFEWEGDSIIFDELLLPQDLELLERINKVVKILKVYTRIEFKIGNV